jgi:hypothetical protein
VVSAGAAITLLGTFLTWLRSGSADRSSYAVFGLVDRLGFSEGGVVGWALRLWPLVPLLLVVTVVIWWWPSQGHVWRVARSVVAAAAAVYAGGVALAVANAPEIGLFERGPGPIVTVLGAVTMLGGTVAALISATRPGPRALP